MTGEIWALLGVNLMVLVAAMSLAAIPSFRTKDPSYIDGIWGLGFVVVAFATLLQTSGDSRRTALVVGLTTFWGVRLAAYLFWRWSRSGPDQRYQTLYGANAPNLRLWGRVFMVQAVLVAVISLPVQLGQVYDSPLTMLNWIAAGFALFGILFEATADAQLTRFKGDPANKGKVMDSGLWRYTRHPNYFGEAVTWWGIGLLAVHNVPTAFALIGPAVITLFLLTRSGIGPLEKQLTQTKPQYADYIARTSAFVPRRPKAAV